MTQLLSYIREFVRTVHTGLLICCFGYAALLIFLNYRYGIEPKILYGITSRYYRFCGFYVVYLTAFAIPYGMVFIFKSRPVPEWKFFLTLLLVAPAIFALKVTFAGLSELIRNNVEGMWGRYLNIVVSLPSRLIVVVIPLLLIWWMGKYEQPFFGITAKEINYRPYLLMLLLMVPLITWASTQHDFLHTYPKLRQVNFMDGFVKRAWPYKLLYEICYGIDFITIELFFRGFLVLAFVRFAGQDAILPMAVFYCSIHFGKPLAECISSFFGGLILGIIVYKTRSITGGLMVHLGIAWMMEAGGVIGNSLRKPP